MLSNKINLLILGHMQADNQNHINHGWIWWFLQALLRKCLSHSQSVFVTVFPVRKQILLSVQMATTWRGVDKNRFQNCNRLITVHSDQLTGYSYYNTQIFAQCSIFFYLMPQKAEYFVHMFTIYYIIWQLFLIIISKRKI